MSHDLTCGLDGCNERAWARYFDDAGDPIDVCAQHRPAANRRVCSRVGYHTRNHRNWPASTKSEAKR